MDYDSEILYLPNIEKEEVLLHLSGTDIIVKIGNYKRNIPLPIALRTLNAKKASFEDGTLTILFE